MAEPAAAEHLRGRLYGCHLLQSEARRCHREQGGLYGHWHRFGRQQGRAGHVDWGEGVLQVLAQRLERPV